MIFDYFKSVSSRGERMTGARICSWNAEGIAMLNMIRDGKSELKRKLPAVAWQASFVGGRRKSSCAVPSGLVMVDVDHVDNPSELYLEKVAKHREELGIVAAHKTPSCRGLRIVAECNPKFDSLEANQRWIGEVCGLEIDTCTKDWARLSFLVPVEYFFYLDEGIFTREPKHKFINQEFEENETNNEESRNDAGENDRGNSVESDCKRMDLDVVCGNVERDSIQTCKQDSDGVVKSEDDDLLCDGRMAHSGVNGHNSYLYKGFPYCDIINTWFSLNGGTPVEGERNVRLFRLALSLRYICDFDEEKIFSVMPRFGLHSAEVRALVKSANNSKRGGRIPADMMAVLYEMGIEKAAVPNEDAATTGGWGAEVQNVTNMDDDFLAQLIEDAERVEENPIPVLPPLVRDFVNITPQSFKQAMVASMLPVLGTLLTRLRAQYLDGVVHAPNFQVVVEAPQASGKSFTRKMVDFLMRPIAEKDSLERVKEQQYLAQMKLLKNAKKLPEEPEIFIRQIPASISIAKLLKRLDKGRGVHLFTYLEELDTLTKSNSAGAWSQKSDIYRNAFDNSEYGQDYMSDNSYSAIVRVFYNMLMCGTPRAVGRFYKDPEDGLCSRVVFCTLPDQFGEQMPQWKKLDSKTRDSLNSMLDDFTALTYDKNGALLPEIEVDMKWLFPEVEAWLEEKRMQAIETQDRALDIFRRRSSVIAFRGAMVIYYCWMHGKKNNKAANFARLRTRQFFRWLADFVLTNQMQKYGTQINNMIEVVHYEKRSKRITLYESLKEQFTLSELQAKCTIYQVKSSLRDMIYIWKKNGLIEQVDRKTYKKLKK